MEIAQGEQGHVHICAGFSLHWDYMLYRPPVLMLKWTTLECSWGVENLGVTGLTFGVRNAGMQVDWTLGLVEIDEAS